MRSATIFIIVVCAMTIGVFKIAHADFDNFSFAAFADVIGPLI
mgnify:FL=1